MKTRKPIHDDWETPGSVLSPLWDEFGPMFDPCPINPKFDGLKVEWASVNFINPPYDRKLKEAFIRKAYAESLKGKTSVMLLPVSTSTRVFHEVIQPNAEVRFLKGRVKFKGVNSRGEKVSDKCGQHDSMIVVFRPKQDKYAASLSVRDGGQA